MAEVGCRELALPYMERRTEDAGSGVTLSGSRGPSHCNNFHRCPLTQCVFILSCEARTEVSVTEGAALTLNKCFPS